MLPHDPLSLLELWERSVQATRSFLSGESIVTIKPRIQEGLSRCAGIDCVRPPDGTPTASIALDGGHIETLFVDETQWGQGLGKALVRFAIEHRRTPFVDVDEQNPPAVAFYHHLGFSEIGRSFHDALAGAPSPSYTWPWIHRSLRIAPLPPETETAPDTGSPLERRGF